MAAAGTDKFQLLNRERDGEGAEVERGSMSEGNANVRAHTPGNEAFSSAGETQLRDSSAAAAEEKQREEEEGVEGRAFSRRRSLSGGLSGKRWRGERDAEGDRRAGARIQKGSEGNVKSPQKRVGEEKNKRGRSTFIRVCVS